MHGSREKQTRLPIELAVSSQSAKTGAPLIIRFIPLLLLALAGSLPLASAAPTVTLVVPSYDYTPGHAENTVATGISNSRLIVGSFTSSRSSGESYLRMADGRFGHPIKFPLANFTQAFGVNDSGVVCGSYLDSASVWHGFFFDGAGYTRFDLPENVNTFVEGENDAGEFVGLGVDPSGSTAFLSMGGVVTTFTVPGSSQVVPRAINNFGQIAGYYFAGSLQHGFFRDADGTLTCPIDYPGTASSTTISGLNDAGFMVGSFNSGNIEHGFVLENGRFTSYDYPGSGATFFGGINNSKTICGYDSGPNGFSHSFVAHFGR